MKGPEIDVRSGPVDFFEGETLQMHCKLTAGNHVSYKWLLNGQLVSWAPLTYDHLLINRSVEAVEIVSGQLLLRGCEKLSVFLSHCQ